MTRKQIQLERGHSLGILFASILYNIYLEEFMRILIEKSLLYSLEHYIVYVDNTGFHSG